MRCQETSKSEEICSTDLTVCNLFLQEMEDEDESDEENDGGMSPVYDREEDPKIFTEVDKKSSKIFTEVEEKSKTKSVKNTPAKAAVGTPKSVRKLFEETGTPKRSNKEEHLVSVATPTRSSRRQSIAPAIAADSTPSRSSRRQSIAPADLTPSRSSRKQTIAPPADSTPPRSSRRQSVVPRRYREDGFSSGEDFEQKTTYRIHSTKKAKTENEMSTPKRGGETSKSSSNKSTPKIEEKSSRPKRRATTMARELRNSESSEEEIGKMYRGKRTKDSEFKLSGKSVKSKDHAASPNIKRSAKKKTKKVESESEEEVELSEDEDVSPKKRSKLSKKSAPNTPKSTVKKRATMTPRIPDRRIKLPDSMSPLQEAQLRLHVAAVPDNLPCRENEFAEIFSFTESKIQDGIGGCMYISGVPGIINFFFLSLKFRRYL
jgi:hypothetical protein